MLASIHYFYKSPNSPYKALFKYIHVYNLWLKTCLIALELVLINGITMIKACHFHMTYVRIYSSKMVARVSMKEL